MKKNKHRDSSFDGFPIKNRIIIERTEEKILTLAKDMMLAALKIVQTQFPEYQLLPVIHVKIKRRKKKNVPPNPNQSS